MTLTKGKIVSGSIQTCAFGGDGILRHDSNVVFVPFTAPGDVVTAQIHDVKKSYAKATLLQIDEPSVDRIESSCQYYGTCGGCQLQHVHYEAQLKTKRTFVVDALSRIARIENPKVEEAIGAETQWHYRRYIRLHLRTGENGLNWGYVTHDAKGLINVEHCPIFSANDQEILLKIKEFCHQFKVTSPNLAAELSIFKAAQDRFVLLFDFTPTAPTQIQKQMDVLLQSCGAIQGIVWRDERSRRHIGDPTLFFELDDLSLQYSPTAFVQSHPEQSAKLYRDLVERVASTQALRVLDLYCGIGVTSLLLARRGIEVLGVEGNREAIDLAKFNAARNQIKNAKWQVADVDEVVGQLGQTLTHDAVIVNPPRTGLNEPVKSALLSFLPKDIFYVSCMPSTLARDVAQLKSAYNIVHCQPYDMFPQTTHVETLIHLQRTK